MKLLVAALFACSMAYAADSSDLMQGTWIVDASKSDWSHKPGGAPRELALTITESGGRTCRSMHQGKERISGLTTKPTPSPGPLNSNSNLSGRKSGALRRAHH